MHQARNLARLAPADLINGIDKAIGKILGDAEGIDREFLGTIGSNIWPGACQPSILEAKR